MQFIRDIFAAKAAAGRPVISFELFPPKTPEGDRSLFDKTLPAMRELHPDYVSVTYGAGGSTREKTLQIVDRVQREHGLPALAHLTCVGATRDQITALLRDIQALGVKNILALRGDPPTGGAEFQMTAGGFAYAYQLVELLRDLGGFSVGVAGFPEGHIACPEGKFVDWDRLQAKVDAGADFIVSQLFFDNADFYQFRDYLTQRGVRVPIVPGIIPILTLSQIQRFVALCGAKLPQPLAQELARHSHDDAATTEYGIEYATRQCSDLLAHGAPGVHFYTLNKAHSSGRVLKNLGLA